MSTEEQARKLAAKERQHEAHVKESMLNRAEAEVHNPDESNLTQEHARELAAQERQHEAHVKESMLNRAKAD
jgi:multidrug efflux pump subunit AcrA (membrane-fusion protein)